MTLGQRIQELRKQAGLSQEGLGEALGVSRQAVSKWEGDNGIPELDTLIAMSRLFGVTIGQLLGIEEDRATGTDREQGTLNEGQVEAILRRYAEESRPAQPEKKPLSWLLPLATGGVLLALIVVLFAQIGGLRDTVSNLRGQLSAVQSDLGAVRGQVSGITEEIRQTLTEEGNLLSTCNYEVVGMDAEAETVTVRFDATLKDYTAGSKMQFLMDWVKTDQTKGQTVSDWVEGPDFSGDITIPMNYHAELSVRVEDGNGNIREQMAETIYSFHPESFELDAYNLMRLIKLEVTYRFQTYFTGYGDNIAAAEIKSNYPEMFRPEQAAVTAFVNDEPVMTAELVLTATEDEGVYEARMIDRREHAVSVAEGDQLTVVLTVTDNLGRVEEFIHGGTINEGELRTKPTEAPLDRIG